MNKRPKTLFEKVWDDHVIEALENHPSVLYIDKHFIHEVTSPQAFSELRKRKLPVFRPKQIVATADHNVPTLDQHLPIKDELSKKQVDMLTENCHDFGVELFGLGHPYQGIVHVIGPELGITQPGMTIVCGDSHTSTHGAFGSIAFGIGTSEVGQVFASQCVLQNKPKIMKIQVDGTLKKGVTAKDIILYIISKISASGGTGYFVEYCGSAIRRLSMEGRMTICNMSIEMGARGGMIAPDETTFEYMKGRKCAPSGDEWEKKVCDWQQLPTDDGAVFDQELFFNADDICPMITFGTNPGMGMSVDGTIPTLDSLPKNEQPNFKKSLDYMGFKDGEKLLGKKIDYVFIGSCTNARIEDLRMTASLIQGKKKANHVEVLVIPGSYQVAQQAEKEGLKEIFENAGFSFRSAGCSACLGMNEDKIPNGKYCVSTSNRNFEGRQGPGARTLLSSPLTAAVSAIQGKISDVREVL